MFHRLHDAQTAAHMACPSAPLMQNVDTFCIRGLHRFWSCSAAGRLVAILVGGEPAYLGAVWLQVSFNGGAHWQDLARPERYRHAGCDRCGNVDPEACRLHLHGPAGVVAAQGDIRLAFAPTRSSWECQRQAAHPPPPPPNKCSVCERVNCHPCRQQVPYHLIPGSFGA